VDHFRVVRQLGKGGMGEVYLARDTTLGRRVALKVIHPKRLGADGAVERFLQEARTTATFNHPNIVAIHFAGCHAGRPYLALEYLEGQTLRKRLREEAPGAKEALRWGLAITDALAEAHRHKILHRDLKPENVMLCRDGRLRVVDFGLAQLIRPAEILEEPETPTEREEGAEPRREEAPEAQQAAAVEVVGGGAGTPPPGRHGSEPTNQKREEGLADGVGGVGPKGGVPSRRRQIEEVLSTVGEQIRGTPEYMAPEQWRSAPVTEAADVWSLGVVLYELLSGGRPYRVKSFFALALKVGSSDPVPRLPGATQLPSAVVELVRRCLDKDPARRPTAAEVADELRRLLGGWAREQLKREESPFRGLRPFTERHAELYFGREDEIAAFLERLREEPVLPVVGPSGAGKSSFVQAGVIPRLMEQGPWIVVRVRPGERPFHALASQLGAAERSASSQLSTMNLPLSPVATGTGGKGKVESSSEAREVSSTAEERGGALAEQLRASPHSLSLILEGMASSRRSRVLLFVDQLEELYTLTNDEEERRLFLEAVCSAADDPDNPMRVVLTVREDFLGRMGGGSAVRRALGSVTLLGPPRADAMAAMLKEPLRLLEYDYDDPQLVPEMITAAGAESAVLPLLQFTAHLLWERRDRSARRLTREAYEEMGGVEGALATHADGVLESLQPAAQRLAREVVLRLVTTERTRRVVPLSRLLEGLSPEGREVVSRLVAARLLVVRRAGQESEDTDDAELELAHESLIRNWSRLARWIDRNQDDMVFLEQAGQTAELWDRRGRREDDLWQGEALRDALTALRRCSASVPESVRAFLEAGQRRQGRRRRQRRVAVAAVVALALLVALVFAYQKRVADRQREAARYRWAEAQREGARAAVERDDLLEARSKLRGSLETEDSALARALWWRLSKDPLQWRRSLGAPVYGVAFTPDGRRVAAVCRDRSLYLVDVQTRAVRILRGYSDQVLAVAVSPDGRRVATGTWSGRVALRGIDDGEPRLLGRHEGYVRSLAFSPDGRHLASTDEKGKPLLFDLTAKREAPRSLATTAAVVAFTADGRLATGGQDGKVRVFRLDGGRPSELRGHRGEVTAVALSTRGLLATGGNDGVVKLRRLDRRGSVQELSGPSGGVTALAFDPEGKWLAASDTHGVVQLWRVDNLRAPAQVIRHQHAVFGLGLWRGGLLATGARDGGLRLWRVGRTTAERARRGHPSAVYAAVFSPDGRQVASGGRDGSVRLWDVNTGRVIRTLSGHTGRVNSVAFGPEGRLLASGGDDRTVRIWYRGGGHTRVLGSHWSSVFSVAFSPDGRTLASGGGDKFIRLWDVKAGEQRAVLKGHRRGVRDLSFTPDGNRLVSGSRDGTVRFWRVTQPFGEESAPLKHGGDVLGIGQGPDGHLVTSCADGVVRLWDLATRAPRELQRGPGRPYKLAFQPRQPRIGVPRSDGSTSLLPLDGGAEVQLSGHRSEVNTLRFGRDGALAVTASDDGTVRIWNATSGRPLWRGPVLLSRPVRLLTHRGWIALESGGSDARAPALAHAMIGRETADGQALCLLTRDGRVERWSPGPKATRMWSAAASGGLDVLATPRGCVTVDGERARVLVGGRLRRELPAAAAAWSGGRLLLAAGRRVIVASAEGDERRTLRGGEGVTALALTGRRVALGFRDGNIELRSLNGKDASPASFQRTPPSAVVSLLGGPRDTLIAGFASGEVGVWYLKDGARLDISRIHGPVVHLMRSGQRLFAATELGDHLVLDLSTFHAPYCKVLRQVWRDVVTVWEGGLPVVRPLPEGHRCR
jgi:WD40 repeat protein/serine/threonine protein kinase